MKRYMGRILDFFYDQQTKRLHDNLIIIVGNEGSSKSTLSLHILEWWRNKLTGKCVAEDIKYISLNTTDFISGLQKAEKYDCFILDEGGEISSRSSMSKANRQLQQLYMAIRGMCMLTIICIPDLWALDSYFVRHRARAVIHITKRGRLKFYKRSQVKKIIALNQSKLIRRINITPPLFDGDFTKYQGVLKAPYEKLKNAKMREAINSLKGGTSGDPEFAKQKLFEAELDKKKAEAYAAFGSKKASEMFSISPQAVRYAVKRHERRKWEKETEGSSLSEVQSEN